MIYYQIRSLFISNQKSFIFHFLLLLNIYRQATETYFFSQLRYHLPTWSKVLLKESDVHFLVVFLFHTNNIYRESSKQCTQHYCPLRSLLREGNISFLGSTFHCAWAFYIWVNIYYACFKLVYLPPVVSTHTHCFCTQ